ncbi:hypothetical protein ACH5RR_034156 [Cinchona calisaya]|uniref:Uncharacterized protein n=1 Tax=Cinchona calisaya TaxID=153742 RepID=A0ABD2YDN8_9GENT
MGSCISKCRPKKKFKKDCNCIEEFSHVHDKLVITQAPLQAIQNPVSPSPSAASSTSFSSVSGANCSTSSGFSMASSLSSSSSSSSSVSIAKDRAFSNEFLWSCVKENPHVVGRNVIKGSLEKSGLSNKVRPNKFDFPSSEKSNVLPVKEANMQQFGRSTPKKRARANSPIMVRQKSFRKEPDKTSSSPTYHLPNRSLMRSPSPSRRFNGESLTDSSTNAIKEIYSRKISVPKANFVTHTSSSTRKESFRTPFTPNYDLNKRCTNSKSNEIEGGCEKEASQDVEAMLVEDINNPLIALDCFIFL